MKFYIELRTGRVGSGQPANPNRSKQSGRVGSGQPVYPTRPVWPVYIRVSRLTRPDWPAYIRVSRLTRPVWPAYIRISRLTRPDSITLYILSPLLSPFIILQKPRRLMLLLQVLCPFRTTQQEIITIIYLLLSLYYVILLYLQNFYDYWLHLAQLFRHIHACILSSFKLDLLFVIRSVPPEKILSIGTLVPI